MTPIPFTDFAKDVFLVLPLCCIRTGVILSLVPFFGDKIITGVGRNAVVIGLSMIVVPMVSPSIAVEDFSALHFSAIALKEAVIGMLISYVTSIMFWVADCVGFFIDNERGSTMASVFDPMSGSETSPTGLLVSKTVVTLFFVSGIFLVFLSILYQSYSLWPVNAFLPHFNVKMPLFFLEIADKTMRLTVVLAAPVILSLFMTDLSLALLNRFAPQLNVFFLSMPIKSAVGLFVLILYSPYLFHFFEDEFFRSRNMLELLKTIFS